ncbi:hypothetical protein [Deinococcus kurensis]|uniref:hypothetical protein n=1 Tax=Deinococcus kurensis TaxID=2662757 RepID=UPI0012D2BC01|nr:hypothetical protein [Deinococcus kurensis]
MTLIDKLPDSLPADNTPKTYAGTKLLTFLLAAGATSIITGATITNTTAVAKDATTMTVSATDSTFIPSGTVLTFGTTQVTTTADVTATAGGAAVAIKAAPAAIALNATATYSNLLEVPTPEESNPTLSDQEETINVHGRVTPIRSVNGKDLTATIRTIAAIDDPVVERLITRGMSLSPNNRERVLWLYPDGFALLATVNIGAPTRQAAPGGTQRVQVTANLSGALAWANLNDTTPTWKEVNAQ